MKLYDLMPPWAKAIAAGVVTAAAYVYFTGVDITSATWWAGGVLWVGAAYGVVWAVPNGPKPT